MAFQKISTDVSHAFQAMACTTNEKNKSRILKSHAFILFALHIFKPECISSNTNSNNLVFKANMSTIILVLDV